MREWLKRPVSTTGELARVPKVRILLIPPGFFSSYFGHVSNSTSKMGNTGVSFKGRTAASKTAYVGSIPTAPARFLIQKLEFNEQCRVAWIPYRPKVLGRRV